MGNLMLNNGIWILIIHQPEIREKLDDYLTKNDAFVKSLSTQTGFRGTYTYSFDGEITVYNHLSSLSSQQKLKL